MKKFIKKYNTQIIIVFLTTLFLEIAFSVTLHFYPFQRANILISDLYYEYVPFFDYLRDAILNGRSILNSFSFSLGQSMVGILSYYCLSPLNIILLFSNTNNIVYFIKILIFIKIILCALNMSIYLNNKTTKLNNIIFSLIYAFITYNLRFGYNLMWLDIIYMLPLAILGVEKMVDSNSNKIYIVCLTIMIFSNFYIAFGACIFILIYFLYYALIKNKLTLKLFWKFMYSSIIACLLNAFMLIPTIYNMLGGKVLEAQAKYESLILYNPKDVIYNFTPGNTFGNTLIDLPYFYSSTLVLVLFINSFFSKEISFKEKSLSFFAFFFIVFTTLLAPLDLLFHCFRVPNMLYYRYIYILPFFLISYVSRNKIKISLYSLIPIMFIIVWALIDVGFSVKVVIFVILLIIYSLLIKFNLKYFLILIVILELFYNVIVNIKIYNGIPNYDDVEKYKDILKDYMPSKNEFYRIELNDPITINDNFIIGSYGIDSFSPTISNNSKKFLKEYLLLPEQNSLNYIYQNRNILDPYILGIRYELIDDKIKENKAYLPLIFKVDNLDYFRPTNLIIENSNNIYKMINGEYFFKEIDFDIDCINDKKIINKKCNLKYDKKDGYNYYLELYVKNGVNNIFKVQKYMEKNYIISVDGTLEFDYDNVYIDSIKLYEYNETKLKNQKNDFEIFSDNYMKLSVDKGIYMTTIPYDDGWHIRLNGKEIKKIKVLDSLIGFEAEDGILELEFIPQGLISGTLISGVTFLSIFIYLYRKKVGD